MSITGIHRSKLLSKTVPQVILGRDTTPTVNNTGTNINQSSSITSSVYSATKKALNSFSNVPSMLAGMVKHSLTSTAKQAVDIKYKPINYISEGLDSAFGGIAGAFTGAIAGARLGGGLGAKKSYDLQKNVRSVFNNPNPINIPQTLDFISEAQKVYKGVKDKGISEIVSESAEFINDTAKKLTDTEPSVTPDTHSSPVNDTPPPPPEPFMKPEHKNLMLGIAGVVALGALLKQVSSVFTNGLTMQTVLLSAMVANQAYEYMTNKPTDTEKPLDLLKSMHSLCTPQNIIKGLILGAVGFHYSNFFIKPLILGLIAKTAFDMFQDKPKLEEQKQKDTE
jgi:hypothetical protein